MNASYSTLCSLVQCMLYLELPRSRKRHCCNIWIIFRSFSNGGNVRSWNCCCCDHLADVAVHPITCWRQISDGPLFGDLIWNIYTVFFSFFYLYLSVFFHFFSFRLYITFLQLLLILVFENILGKGGKHNNSLWREKLKLLLLWPSCECDQLKADTG